MHKWKLFYCSFVRLEATSRLFHVSFPDFG